MAALVLQAPAPATTDTTVVVQGVLVQGPPPPSSGSGWLLVLPTPFRFRDHVIAQLEVTGDSARWSRFNSHYVEARGAVSAEAALHITALREVDPEGTVRKTVSTSLADRVVVVLWVLPQRFSWRDAEGRPTGVRPAIVYTLYNHGESEVTLTLQTRDFVCFSVEPRTGAAPPWHQERQWHERLLQQPTDRIKVKLTKFVREVAEFPSEATPEPGRYVVRAGLCGFKEYELETEIEVVR